MLRLEPWAGRAQDQGYKGPQPEELLVWTGPQLASSHPSPKAENSQAQQLAEPPCPALRSSTPALLGLSSSSCCGKEKEQVP